MKGLQLTQLALQHYVMGDGAVSAELAAGIRQQGALDAAGRLAIYHHAYRARMREALGEAFAKTWTYAGDELFAQLVDVFLAEHHSSFANLRWFGAAFPDLVRRQLPDHPAVAELAQFEWALGLAFDAPDAMVAGPRTYRDLGAQEWAALRLQLHPSVQLLRMRTNAVALWQAMESGEDPPEPLQTTASVTWAVWRKDLQPHFRSIDDVEAQALEGAAAGLTFEEICEQAALQAGDAPQRMAGCLRSWLDLQMLRC
jgi:hypothetical protein